MDLALNMTYKDWYAIKSNQPTNQPPKFDIPFNKERN